MKSKNVGGVLGKNQRIPIYAKLVQNHLCVNCNFDLSQITWRKRKSDSDPNVDCRHSRQNSTQKVLK